MFLLSFIKDFKFSVSNFMYIEYTTQLNIINMTTSLKTK